MIIIYHCYGGAHSSVLSAAIHCGLLPQNRVPINSEIANLPFYDKTNSKDIGKLFYFGSDTKNNKIYIQGMGNEEKVIIAILKEILNNYGISKNEIILVNTLKNVNWMVRIGGFLSRRLGLIFPGRKLTIIGIKKTYQKFLNTVTDVKSKL